MYVGAGTYVGTYVGIIILPIFRVLGICSVKCFDLYIMDSVGTYSWVYSDVCRNICGGGVIVLGWFW